MVSKSSGPLLAGLPLKAGRWELVLFEYCSQQLMNKPVSPPCGHSICMFCMKRDIDMQMQSKSQCTCFICTKPFGARELVTNSVVLPPTSLLKGSEIISVRNTLTIAGKFRFGLVFIFFTVHTKTQSRLIQISPV